MAYCVVWRHISPKVGKEDEVLEALKPVVQYAKDNNSKGILGMWVWRQVPEDTSTGIVPWVYREDKGRPFTGEQPAIMTQEVYVTEDDYGAINNSMAYLTFETVTGHMLAGPPQEQHLTPRAGFPFRNDKPCKTTDKLYAVTARVAYKEGTLLQGVQCWNTVTSYVKKEEVDGTVMYWFLTDRYDKVGLYSLEVYRDEEAFDVHKVCDAVVNNRNNQVDNLKIRTGVNIRVLKQEMSSFD
ncbi:hypothetical protein SEUCBS140593_005393 [Sporothrix eucalyptigena]|uniref:ABM domain-containing protein n=1 Tax=Sporothrix eucalyptigena TaxID=1812306 RepID=A0ABP0BXZ9_9PEZI